MHCELGKVRIYPEICTLIYSDFSGASWDVEDVAGLPAAEVGVGTLDGPGGLTGELTDCLPDFIRQKKLRRDPAEDKKEGDDSVFIETPVFMSIRRSRGPWSAVNNWVLSVSASSGWSRSKSERPSKS